MDTADKLWIARFACDRKLGARETCKAIISYTELAANPEYSYFADFGAPKFLLRQCVMSAKRQPHSRHEIPEYYHLAVNLPARSQMASPHWVAIRNKLVKVHQDCSTRQFSWVYALARLNACVQAPIRQAILRALLLFLQIECDSSVDTDMDLAVLYLSYAFHWNHDLNEKQRMMTSPGGAREEPIEHRPITERQWRLIKKAVKQYCARSENRHVYGKTCDIIDLIRQRKDNWIAQAICARDYSVFADF